MMKASSSQALIGSSGFVGNILQRQTRFEGLFNSTTIDQVHNSAWDGVFCAAAPAAKWIANKNPEADRENLLQLISHLEQVECRYFVLISTVDVFSTPLDVNEDSHVNEDGLHSYGLHRRMLEKFVQERFEEHLIVRLPGLVGPGLKKNVIFDFLNNNNLHMIDSRGVFQFYPMINLLADIKTALAESLRLVHLTAEPISVAEVASEAFGFSFDQVLEGQAARYDMRSKYAALFGGNDHYQYSDRESLQAIRAYAQTEPLRGES